MPQTTQPEKNEECVRLLTIKKQSQSINTTMDHRHPNPALMPGYSASITTAASLSSSVTRDSQPAWLVFPALGRGGG